MGCQSFIYAHITKNKDFLEIKEVNLKHNYHEDSKAFIDDIPENRRLSPGINQMAVNSMDLKCSKKLLQNKITKEKGVKIRTKDLSNIHRKNRELKTNDLQVVEKILKRKGADVHILHNNNNVKTELEHHDYVTFWNEKFEENVINPENIEENYQINYKSLQITTTLKSCECLHWLTLSLPCRHIFSIRKHYGLSLFSEDLCSVRWSKNYYRQHQRSFRNLNQKSIMKVKQTQVSKVNLPQQNFDKIELQKQCKYIINDLKHTMSLSCGQYFENKLKVLNDINFFLEKDRMSQ
ncbi:uncharacterized protein LOC141534877 isoform X1 [Cotesia typhae]|uniref:uncharacterized protein LOC141534877 isoform X1 n=1 Tax=Cotesia typhae TaxID=2053667 RepID=UPI003D688575